MRFSSYVRDGVLHIRPTLTADRFGEDFLYNGTLDLWPEGCNINYNGGCVAYVRGIFVVFVFFYFLFFYYLFISIIHVHASTIRLSLYHHLSSLIRTSNEDIINPIQSARMRTINSFSFTYGTVEIRAKMPRGDWIWPGIHSIRLFSFFFFFFVYFFTIVYFLSPKRSYVDDAN